MKTRKQDSTHACYFCFDFFRYDEYVSMDRTSDGAEICDSCQIDSIIRIDTSLSTLEIEQHLIELNAHNFGDVSSLRDEIDLRTESFDENEEEDRYAEYDDEYYHTSMEKFNKRRDPDY